MKIIKSDFGQSAEGKKVYKYTLSNKDVEISVTNYGCIIIDLFVPDKTGKKLDIVLGHKTFEEYLKSKPYFGALIGPVAGRIAEGKYKIGNKEFKLEQNERSRTHLHSGAAGLDKVIWNSTEYEDKSLVGVEFTCECKYSDFGYPGTVKYKVNYELNDNNEFNLLYYAESDEATPVNLTNHSYFNLNGEDSGRNILNQQIKINSKYFVPLDSYCIPTGEILKSENTPFDFCDFKKLGEVINSSYSQVQQAGGFDHPILMDFEKDGKSQVSAYNPENGILLEVFTDQNCLVFYTCNGMDGSIKGKKGTPYIKQYAFCFESQGIPDAVNKMHFPSIIIDKDKPYSQKTVWKFSAK